MNWGVHQVRLNASKGEDVRPEPQRRHPVGAIRLIGRYQDQHRRRDGISRGFVPDAPGQVCHAGWRRACRLSLVRHAGFEPAISP